MRFSSALLPTFPVLPVLAVLSVLAPAAASEIEPPADETTVTHRPGVAPHAGVDAVYEGFAAGYRALDPAAVAALYTEGALYMPEGGETLQGRGAIEASFRRFFDSVRADGARLAIRFEILARTEAVGMKVDEGIYTLRRIEADGTEGEPSRGRFTVVAVRDADGKWRFHVDSFGPIDAAEGTTAEPVVLRELVPGIRPKPTSAYGSRYSASRVSRAVWTTSTTYTTRVGSSTK